MPPGAPGVHTRVGPGRAWIHLGALVVFAGAVEIASALSGGVGEGPSFSAVLAHLPDFYFGTLPVLVAISVGMLSFSGATTRHAILLVVATTLTMLVLDLFAGLGSAGATANVTLQQGGSVESAPSGDYTGISLVRTLMDMTRNGVDVPPARLAPLDAQDPRLRASFAVLKLAHLFLPAVLVGIVLGVQAWVADHVVFRRPVDELVARIVLAWVFAPAAFFLTVRWAQKLGAQALFWGAPIVAPFLPIGVMLLVAALGWSMARRVARWSS